MTSETYPEPALIIPSTSRSLIEEIGTTLAASVFIAPRKRESELSHHPYGTGSYRFVRFQKGTLEAKAFADCWKGKPSIEKVNFVTVQHRSNTVEALRSGEVDVLRWVPEHLSTILLHDSYRKSDASSFDPESAKLLLIEAGYPNGFDITLTVAEGAEFLGRSVCDMLMRVGIRAQMETMNWPLMKSRWHSGLLRLFIGSWMFTIGEPSFFLQDCFLTRPPDSTQSWNPGYSNPELDRIILNSLNSFGISRENQLIQAVQMAAESQPLVPLFTRFDLFGIRETIQWTPRRDGNLLAAEMRFSDQLR